MLKVIALILFLIKYRQASEKHKRHCSSRARIMSGVSSCTDELSAFPEEGYCKQDRPRIHVRARGKAPSSGTTYTNSHSSPYRMLRYPTGMLPYPTGMLPYRVLPSRMLPLQDAALSLSLRDASHRDASLLLPLSLQGASLQHASFAGCCAIAIPTGCFATAILTGCFPQGWYYVAVTRGNAARVRTACRGCGKVSGNGVKNQISAILRNGWA